MRVWEVLGSKVSIWWVYIVYGIFRIWSYVWVYGCCNSCWGLFYLMINIDCNRLGGWGRGVKYVGVWRWVYICVICDFSWYIGNMNYLWVVFLNKNVILIGIYMYNRVYFCVVCFIYKSWSNWSRFCVRCIVRCLNIRGLF